MTPESRVLIIDSDEISALVMKRVLLRLDIRIQVDVLKNAQDAMAYLNHPPPNNLPLIFIFLDPYKIEMELFDFLHLYHGLSEELKAKQLFISSVQFSQKQLQELPGNPEVTELFPKPLTVEKFLELKKSYL